MTSSSRSLHCSAEKSGFRLEDGDACRKTAEFTYIIICPNGWMKCRHPRPPICGPGRCVCPQFGVATRVRGCSSNWVHVRLFASKPNQHVSGRTFVLHRLFTLGNGCECGARTLDASVSHCAHRLILKCMVADRTAGSWVHIVAFGTLRRLHARDLGLCDAQACCPTTIAMSCHVYQLFDFGVRRR